MFSSINIQCLQWKSGYTEKEQQVIYVQRNGKGIETHWFLDASVVLFWGTKVPEMTKLSFIDTTCTQRETALPTSQANLEEEWMLKYIYFSQELWASGMCFSEQHRMMHRAIIFCSWLGNAMPEPAPVSDC